MVATVIAAMVIPFLAACGSSRADPVTSARQLDGAPAWVHQPVGTDCGEAEVSRDGNLPQASKRCLTQLTDEEQTGTLAFIRWTTEGDPGVSFVLVDGSTVRVASILEHDSYGGGSGWHEQSCETIASLPDCR